MKKAVRFSSIDVAAIVFIMWTTGSIYNSSDTRLSVFEIIRVAKLYLLSHVVASNVKRKGDMQDVLVALLIGLVLQSVMSVLQYTGIHLALGFSPVGELRRVVGTLGWPNTLGAYSAAIVSCALTLWIWGAGGRSETLIRAACMVGFLPLILTFSRGAWLALLAAVAFSLFLGWRKAWLGTSGLVRLVVAALSAAIIGASVATSITARLNEETLADRFRLNQVAVSMIKAHPVVGVGINTFVDVMRRYDTTGVSSYFPQPVHNVFLLVAAETGLVGLGLFLLLILSAFRVGLRAAKTDDRFLSVCAIGVLSGLIVLVVSNLLDVHLRTDGLYALFWLLIGLVSAIRTMNTSTAIQAMS